MWNIVILDTEAPWTRSLLHAMPSEVRIHGFRVHNAFYFPGGFREQLKNVGKSEKITEAWDDTWVSIPGWHKAFGLSSWLVKRQVEKAIRRHGQPDIILFNLPWYAGVAESFRDVGKVYYAYDPYRFYGWNGSKVTALEKRLLDHCLIGFAVAKLLVQDLQTISSTPVHYLPNATSWRPGDCNTIGAMEAEKDFNRIPMPRVGCVGQINSVAYDWDLIEYLSEHCPNAHFVFIGPRFKEPACKEAARMEAVFSRANVHWLGPKPHEHLPAYLNQCQVLLNPLCVNDHNNRRSLLRLYDYLVTDKPILSTAVSEAYEHSGFIEIGRDTNECLGLLKKLANGDFSNDCRDRHEYIQQNTWRQRAETFLQMVVDPPAVGPSHRQSGPRVKLQ